MMPQLMEAIAFERTRDRERSSAAPHLPSEATLSPRAHRVDVRIGYWLISLGCRLVAPDLSVAAR
jgi:hypothetical protein